LKTETRQKRIHYKRVVFTENKSHLQDLMKAVFQKKHVSQVCTAGNRKEVVNANDQSYRLINHYRATDGMFFGQMIYLEAGKAQGIVEIDDDATYYTVKNLTTDKLSHSDDKNAKKKMHREFIDSVLYFGVYKNHLVVMQSTSQRARELESHLNWLLRENTQSIPTDSAVILQDSPSKATYKKLEKKSARKIKLGTPIGSTATTALPAANSASTKLSSKNVRYAPTGAGSDILKTILGDSWKDTLNLEDTLDEANLRINLEISYDRKTSDAGQKLLDDVATSLRNIDPEDVRVELQGGGLLKGEDLKLSGPISVRMTGGAVDEGELYQSMRDWLMTKIDKEEIELSDES